MLCFSCIHFLPTLKTAIIKRLLNPPNQEALIKRSSWATLNIVFQEKALTVKFIKMFTTFGIFFYNYTAADLHFQRC